MKYLLLLLVISLYVIQTSEGSHKHHKQKHHHNHQSSHEKKYHHKTIKSETHMSKSPSDHGDSSGIVYNEYYHCVESCHCTSGSEEIPGSCCQERSTLAEKKSGSYYQENSDSEEKTQSSYQASSESVEQSSDSCCKDDCEGSEGVDILILQNILEVCGPGLVLETCECGDNKLYWNDCVVNNTGKIKDGPAPRSCLSLTELDKLVKRKMEADKKKTKANC